MAADADTPNRELTVNAAKHMSSTSLSHTDESSVEPKDGTAEPTAVANPEAADDRAREAESCDRTVDHKIDNSSEVAATAKRRPSHVRLALIVGAGAAVVLSALVGWLGVGVYQSHRAQQQRELFLQVGRQGALNLTTIDWQHADTDVQRILDSATGTFYDEFSKRQQPFIDVVKKAQSKSVGTITEAGLESESDDEAQLVVAMSVKTSNLGAAEQPPQEWRMRISVTKVGGEVKVSNVRFVL